MDGIENRKPKYAFAYDEEHRLVKISSLTKEDRKEHVYKCISCGATLIPKLGDLKIHHFAHKVDVECNNETYLHRLAKEFLKKRFDESESFEISLYQWSKCALYNQCPTHQADNTCGEKVLRTYDLKKYYSDCFLEEWDPVTQKRPDLKLVSEDPKKPPIWIEIVVTNRCSKEKVQCKNRIIEIKVENEQQAERLFDEKIKESPSDTYCGHYDTTSGLTINFYNFEQKGEPIWGYENMYKSRSLATLLKSGDIHISRVSCRKNPIINEEGVAAVIFHDYMMSDNDITRKARKAFAKSSIGNFKTCSWCQNYKTSVYGNSYCYYHKHLGIVGPPDTIHAYFCDWCYKPIFSDNLPTVILKEGFSLEQVRKMMRNLPSTPTERPVYDPVESLFDKTIPPLAEEKKSEFYIPYVDDPLLPFIADGTAVSKGSVIQSCRYSTAIYNTLIQNDKTKEWAMKDAGSSLKGNFPCLVFETNIGKYRIVCKNPLNNRSFVGYRMLDDSRSVQIFDTDNHDLIVDLIEECCKTQFES